jgi:alkylation response protein AidB-like acyl-CoA dehydrogenase
MDFAFDESETSVRDLARKLCEAEVTVERLKQIERGPDRFDAALWKELAASSLLGVGLPEDVGGGGLGFKAICLLLEELGRAVAYVPALPTLVLGALPIARFGTPAQRQQFLPKVISGELILSAALAEAGSDDPARPSTRAHRDGAGWRLDGVKECVPAGLLAPYVLVPASTGDGTVGVFILDRHAPGVSWEAQRETSGDIVGRLTLKSALVKDDLILGDVAGGASIVRWIVDRALVGLSAVEVGLCERAVRMTADYATQRQQFDRPIATFQAVAQRVADAYIDTESIRLALWHAAFRIDQGQEVSREAAIAKFWASEGSHRVVSAAQHVHGGAGFDRDYPLHRYYLWSKQIEFTLGGASAQLARLGAMIREG